MNVAFSNCVLGEILVVWHCCRLVFLSSVLVSGVVSRFATFCLSSCCLLLLSAGVAAASSCCVAGLCALVCLGVGFDAVVCVGGYLFCPNVFSGFV